jgi:hypothetical protein
MNKTKMGALETPNSVFYKSESKNYGVIGYEEVVQYAIECNITLEEAGNIYGLTDEQKDFVKLMQARDLYKNGLIKEGNIHLNKVEETPNKSKEVNMALDDIRKRKTFYQYREVEKPKILAFVKPGRRK